jgi:hypothetical protein
MRAREGCSRRLSRLAHVYFVCFKLFVRAFVCVFFKPSYFPDCARIIWRVPPAAASPASASLFLDGSPNIASAAKPVKFSEIQHVDEPGCSTQSPHVERCSGSPRGQWHGPQAWAQKPPSTRSIEFAHLPIHLTATKIALVRFVILWFRLLHY